MTKKKHIYTLFYDNYVSLYMWGVTADDCPVLEGAPGMGMDAGGGTPEWSTDEEQNERCV